MALVAPFRALRYDPRRIPDLGAVVAPPYDVIGPEEREALLSRHPHNSVRLILETGEDRYARAARRMAEWRETGILVRDERPGLYLVEERYHVRDARGRDVERRRRGLVALVRIEAPEAQVILPHERTLAAPRDDRFRLMAAVNAHLSPVFLLAPDKDGSLASLLDEAAAGETLADFTQAPGAFHRLARVDAASIVARLRDALADRPLLIADGHHRYETARAYRDRRREEVGGSGTGHEPWEFVMALVASLDDPGTTVLGYHRVVRETGLGADALRARLSGAFTVERVARRAEAARLERLLTAMTEADARGENAFGVAMRGDDGLYLVRRPRDVSSPPLRRLDVSVLHQAVFEEALGMTEEDFTEQRRIDYTPDPEAALAKTAGGTHAAAFLLNPTPASAVLAIASGGEVLPQKSTYFYPKLLTGLTFHPIDPGDRID